MDIVLEISNKTENANGINRFGFNFFKKGSS